MLSLASISEAQGRTYYQKENYYAKEEAQIYSQWFGKAAVQIGLRGDVRFAEFDNLLHGKSPDGSKVWNKFPKPKSNELSSLAHYSLEKSIGAILERTGIDPNQRDQILVAVMEGLKNRPSSYEIKRIQNAIGTKMRRMKTIPTSAMLTIKKQIREQLQTIKSYPSRRAALDLTFSAPKSVSIQSLVFNDQRLILAHRQAIAEAMRQVEERFAQYRAGTKKERTVSNAGKLVVAQFEHDVSRKKDPQLHTHNVLLNLLPTEGGGWKALHNEQIFRNSILLGLIYQNELSRQCEELGYETTIASNGTFELKGYSKEQLEVFSKRRLQMEALGIESAKDAQVKVLMDRDQKGEDIPRSELRTRWQAEANNAGISEIVPPELRLEKAVHTLPKSIEAAIRQVSERDVKFTLSDIEKAVLANNLGRFTYGDIRQRALGEVGRGILETKTAGVYTSLHALTLEKETRGLAMVSRRSLTQILPGRELTPLLDRISNPQEIPGPVLNSGQAEAIRDALTTTDAITLWHGVAGAGKTTTLRYLAEVLTAKGYTVGGFASSAAAARVLGEGAGIGTKTLARLLLDDKPAPEVRPYWVIDEASLVSAGDMKRLLELREIHQARILLVGDTRQLSSVEAGAPFRDLCSVIKPSELSQSVRQKTELLKEAVALMNAGRVKDGLKKIDRDISETRTPQKRILATAREFLQRDPVRRESTMVITRTNQERTEITGLIRDDLKKAGVLRNPHSATVYEGIDLLKGRLRYAASAEVGDLLVPTRGIRRLGLQKGQSYEIVGKDTVFDQIFVKGSQGQTVKLDLATHSDHALYRPRTIELAEGDRLIWTRNQHDQGRMNNDLVEVLKIENTIATLKYESGRIEEIDLSERQFLDHAWVLTVNKSQGLTVREVIGSIDVKTPKESLYVMTTRASHDVKFFCDDKEKLFEMAEVSGANKTATELVSHFFASLAKAAQGQSEISRKSPEPDLEIDDNTMEIGVENEPELVDVLEIGI